MYATCRFDALFQDTAAPRSCISRLRRPVWGPPRRPRTAASKTEVVHATRFAPEPYSRMPECAQTLIRSVQKDASHDLSPSFLPHHSQLTRLTTHHYTYRPAQPSTQSQATAHVKMRITFAILFAIVAFVEAAPQFDGFDLPMVDVPSPDGRGWWVSHSFLALLEAFIQLTKHGT